MISSPSVCTADFSAGVSAPPKNVSPMPTRPWSVPSSSVTNSRVSVVGGSPTTSGLSAGVRMMRVVTWLIFMLTSGGESEEGCHALRVEHRRHLVVGRGLLEAARRVEHARQQRQITGRVDVDARDA